MQTRDKDSGLIAKFTDAWQKRQPYALTKKTLIFFGILCAMIAVWNLSFGRITEGFVPYGFISTMLFMLRYALTHF